MQITLIVGQTPFDLLIPYYLGEARLRHFLQTEACRDLPRHGEILAYERLPDVSGLTPIFIPVNLIFQGSIRWDCIKDTLHFQTIDARECQVRCDGLSDTRFRELLQTWDTPRGAICSRILDPWVIDIREIESYSADRRSDPDPVSGEHQIGTFSPRGHADNDAIV